MENPKQKRVRSLRFALHCKFGISNHSISYISSEHARFCCSRSIFCCSHSRSNHSTHPTSTWYTHRSGTQPLGSWSFKLRNFTFWATSSKNSKYNGNSSDHFPWKHGEFPVPPVVPDGQLIGAKALFNTSLELHAHCSTSRDDDLFHRNVGLNLNPVLLGQSRQGVFDTLPTWNYEMMHE